MPYLIVMACLLSIMSTPASSSDMNYCRPYAAKLTQTFINYVWKRAYSACLNVEGSDPLPPNNWLTAWQIVAPEADLKLVEASPRKVDVSKIGNVPATADPTPAASADPPSDPVDPVDQPVKKHKVIKVASADPTPSYASGAPQALCTSHKMRTVYTANGKSWNCRK